MPTDIDQAWLWSQHEFWLARRRFEEARAEQFIRDAQRRLAEARLVLHDAREVEVAYARLLHRAGPGPAGPAAFTPS